MHDLVVLFHEVQLRGHALLPLESSLTHREETLDHELHALVNLALVEDASEPLENAVKALRRELVEGVPALLHEFDRHLHRIVRRGGE